jgi:hypothetical protein
LCSIFILILCLFNTVLVFFGVLIFCKRLICCKNTFCLLGLSFQINLYSLNNNYSYRLLSFALQAKSNLNIIIWQNLTRTSSNIFLMHFFAIVFAGDTSRNQSFHFVSFLCVYYILRSTERELLENNKRADITFNWLLLIFQFIVMSTHIIHYIRNHFFLASNLSPVNARKCWGANEKNIDMIYVY